MLTYRTLQTLEDRDAVRSDDDELRTDLAAFGFADFGLIPDPVGVAPVIIRTGRRDSDV